VVFGSTAKFLVIAVWNQYLHTIFRMAMAEWFLSPTTQRGCSYACPCGCAQRKTCERVTSGDWLSLVITTEWSQQLQQQQQKRIIILHKSSNNHPRFRSTIMLFRVEPAITIYIYIYNLDYILIAVNYWSRQRLIVNVKIFFKSLIIFEFWKLHENKIYYNMFNIQFDRLQLLPEPFYTLSLQGHKTGEYSARRRR